MTLEQEVIFYKNMVKLYKFDALTGMKMRHDFRHETLHKFAGQQFYLTMYDITGVHEVNRSRGIEAGDCLIRQVASDIQHLDGIWECYRIGGDEFMVITFEKPECANVANATYATVYSGDYEIFSNMVTAVDSLVTTKKELLGRRRED